MSLRTIVFTAFATLAAAGCHDGTRKGTGNTGDSYQPSPTGTGNQIGTHPRVATGTGSVGTTVFLPPDQSQSTGYGPAPGMTAAATGNPLQVAVGSGSGSGSNAAAGSGSSAVKPPRTAAADVPRPAGTAP